MSQALALIAHDLKNALGSLEAELAALPQLGDLALQQAASAQAHRHCQALRQEFIHFLTLYTAETGELRPLCEDESPAQLLEALAHQWQARLQAEGVTLAVTVQPPLPAPQAAPPFWYLDRRLVRLALDAAIHNATRFARSQVSLSCRQEADWLVISVQDDGPGLNHGPTDARSGTGLGTALAQAVAQVHRLGERCGRITLQNTSPTGAQFSLWLP